tara:strand:- start:5597 stop:6463 length:867 start_codon:yes stop_codon:yes gene_type:complete
MKNQLIFSIIKNFKKVTNKRILVEDVKDYILPIYSFLNNSNKKMFLISGAQGIGKTTILNVIEKNFYFFFKKRILRLSLDDFYYSKKERNLLSQSIHSLMLTRGVPGTHNIEELSKIISKFKSSKYPIYIPSFNKLKDTRNSYKKVIKKKCDILILEGWCCGSPPLSKKYLHHNINILEKKFDKNYEWRNYYNNKLKNEYSKLFKKFDKLIYFKTNSFNNVLKWRLNQERKMQKKYKIKKNGMNKKEISEFVQYYEKITKWMIKKLPKQSSITIFVDKNQKIRKISNA